MIHCKSCQPLLGVVCFYWELSALIKNWGAKSKRNYCPWIMIMYFFVRVVCSCWELSALRRKDYDYVTYSKSLHQVNLEVQGF